MRSLSLSRRGKGRGRAESPLVSRSSRRRAARVTAMAAREAHYRSEWLEPRLLLAAHTWTGGALPAINQFWSIPQNWSGNVAPAANEADVALVFPVAALQKTTIDDIPNLAQVDSITFLGTAYTVVGSGTTIHLNAPGAGFNVDDQAGGNTLGDANLTIAMTPGEWFRVTTGRLNVNARLVNDGANVGSLNKKGLGILQLGGSSSNSYTGATIVSEGTLELNNSASVCFSGDLFVGDGIGGAQADVLRELSNGDFAGTTNITIQDSGWVDMGSSLDNCNNITMNGGLLSSATGQLGMGGTLTATSTVNGSATISGLFRMSPGTHIFQIDDGPTFVDLNISALLGQTGPSAGFTKAGNGRLDLTGTSSNTYTGTTTLWTGQMDLGKPGGGAIPGPFIIGDGLGGASADVVRNLFYGQSYFSDVTVNSSGLYDFNGQGDILNSLTINDGNVAGGCQVDTVNMTGGTINGGITLTGTLTAVSDSTQTPTINGVLDLFFTGGVRTFNINSGPLLYDLVVNATITDSANIVKTGTGYLNLAGSNNFNGAMTVNQGLLYLSNNNALSDTTSGTTLNNGGAIVLNSAHIPAEPLTINTNGSPYAGALNTFTNSAWDGPITLGVSTIINAGSGGTLALNGVVSGAGGLTKVGAGILQLFGSSANTYGGTTTVNEGSLLTNKISGVAIPHDLVVGDNAGGVAVDTVRTLHANNLAHLSTVTVTGSGGLVLDGTEDIGTLNLQDGAQARMSSTVGGTSVLVLRSGESIAPTARLDLTNNSMIWDYTGATPLILARVRLISGYAGGAWNGNGINSSTAAATSNTAVGYAESAGISSTFPWSFQGFSVDSTAVLFRYTIMGDDNLDHTVNLTDFTFLASNFNGTGRNWWQGDYNYDGKVDLTDFTILASNFNQTLPAAAPAAAPAMRLVAAAPPPAVRADSLWSQQRVSSPNMAVLDDLG